jgi:ribosome-associated protein
LKQRNKLLDIFAQALFDKKGFNILALDVRKFSSMTDYYIIAEGNVERHVKSLYSALKKVCDTLHVPIYHAEGQLQGDWVVIDCGDVIVHLLIPEQRERYALESLWGRAEIVDVEIDVSAKRA